MNLNRNRILPVAALCLFTCLFLFTVSRMEQQAPATYYTLTYHPLTDQEASEADQNYAVMCRRVSALMGDVSCKRTADGGFTITVDSQLGGCTDIGELKALLFSDAIRTHISNWDDYTTLVDDDDIMDLTFCEDDTGSYLEFHVTADAGTQIAEAYAENADVRGIMSVHSHDRDNVYLNTYSISPAEDSTVWRCYLKADDAADKKIFAYIRNIGPLSADLKSNISSYVTWMNPQGEQICGDNQILLPEDPNNFPADYTILYYCSSERHTKDEREYLLVSTEAKLDTMGIPYALGYDPNGNFVIAVPADDAIERMASLLCSNFGIYLQTETSAIYVTLDDLMIDADGVTLLLDDNDAETLKKDLTENSDQQLRLTLGYDGTTELARTSGTVQAGAFMITFDQFPEDAPWMLGFLSAAAQYGTSDLHWTYSWIS